jgi:hypothetical protein
MKIKNLILPASFFVAFLNLFFSVVTIFISFVSYQNSERILNSEIPLFNSAWAILLEDTKITDNAIFFSYAGEAQYKEGDELFFTGKDQMIYFPRKEHAIVKYGN